MRGHLATIGFAASLILLVSCSGPAATPAVDSDAPSMTSGPSPSASTADGAPAELRGTWQTDVGEGPGGNILKLTLGANTYRITRGPNSGQGSIAVNGDQIEFSRSNLCDGSGTYRWSLDGDSLTFTAVGAPDPCGGVRVLDGHTYTRID